MWITEFMKDFQDIQNELSRFSRPGNYPKVRIWENENEVIVEARIPGANPETLDITVSDDVLNIAGEVLAKELGEDEQIIRSERLHGRFSRSLELPKAVNAGEVSAAYTDGILNITLPIREDAKPKKIAVSIH